jgi:hypothetical protein
MKAKRNFFAWNRYALSNMVEGQMRMIFLFFLLAGISTTLLQAQTQVSALGAGLEVSVTQSAAGTGESAVVLVSLDDSAATLTDVIGFELELDLDSQLDLNCLVDYEGSCIPSGVQGQIVLTYSYANQRITISLADVASFDAEGLLFSLELVSVAGSALPENLAVTGGGFMIVDDIGFKQAPGSEIFARPEPVVYPTHCQGMLHFDWKGQEPVSVMLVDVRGAQIAMVPKAAIQQGFWAVGGLPSGLYKVVVGYENEQRVVRNVWLE